MAMNARDRFGFAPLNECCIGGHLDVARLLIGAKADVNVPSKEGRTAPHETEWMSSGRCS